MLTVAILINGKPIMARSAVNIGNDGISSRYKLDDGNIIRHDPEDGAVALAIEMLKSIKEVKEHGP